MHSLQGRRALVCGSTQGIGRASAEALAVAGAEVVLLARNQDQLRAVRDALPRGERVVHDSLVADFSDPPTVRRVVSEYLSDHPAFREYELHSCTSLSYCLASAVSSRSQNGLVDPSSAANSASLGLSALPTNAFVSISTTHSFHSMFAVTIFFSI